MFLTKVKIVTTLMSVAMLGWSDNVVIAQKPARSEQKPAALSGWLKEIDTAKNRITVTLPPTKKGEPGEEKTVTLAKELKVFFDDGRGGKTMNFLAGNRADLKEGAFVLAILTSDLQEVVVIRAAGPTVSGTLKAIDGEKSTIVLAFRKKIEEQDRAYALVKDVSVFIDGKPGKFTDLVTDVAATLILSGDQKVVGTIRVEGPTLQGIVKAVDAVQNTITFTVPKKGEPPHEETYAVAKDAKVFLYGREIKLNELASEAHVTIKVSALKKEALGIAGQGPTLHGVLKAVDAAQNTVTVLLPPTMKNQPGEEKTFSLIKDVQINIAKGKMGKLSDLEIERQVILSLSIDQKQVRSVAHGAK